MAKGDNQAHVLFQGVPFPTLRAETAVTGRRFVSISDAPSSGPGLSSTGEGSNLVGEHATAAGNADGVARYDAPLGETFAVVGKNATVQVDAGGTFAAGQEVEVGTGGKAVVLASGKAVGRAVTAGVNNATAYIFKY
jgi:hypothetical protein